MNVDVQLVKKIELIALSKLRETKGLETMVILQRGNRLSITPVTEQEWAVLGV
jgi:predicted RNA-binding protein with PUA-like domain